MVSSKNLLHLLLIGLVCTGVVGSSSGRGGVRRPPSPGPTSHRSTHTKTTVRRVWTGQTTWTMSTGRRARQTGRISVLLASLGLEASDSLPWELYLPRQCL